MAVEPLPLTRNLAGSRHNRLNISSYDWVAFIAADEAI